MNSREFYNKVVLMRKYQREYFRTHSPAAKRIKTKLEAEIDEEIIRVNKVLGKEQKTIKQANLFQE